MNTSDGICSRHSISELSLKMPFSPERTQLIMARLEERLASGKLNDWERSFCLNMQTRFARDGARTRLSDRQYQRLHTLLKISREQNDTPTDEILIDMSPARQRTSSYRRSQKPKPTYVRPTRHNRQKRTPTLKQTIYAPRRAARRLQRMLAIPTILVVALVALVNGLFSPSGSGMGASSPTVQTQYTPPTTSTLYVTGTRVNQRDGPSTSSRILGSLPKGASVQKIQSQGGWTQIRSSLGTGWMSSRYLSSAASPSRPAQTPTSRGSLRASDIRVIDGDTIKVRGQPTNTRLVGFNTPETRSAACNRERSLGQQATSRLATLIRNAQKLEFERVACACRPGTQGTKQCNYGRGCGTLRVDGTDVGRLLISEGLAVRYICGRTRCPRRPGNWCQ